MRFASASWLTSPKTAEAVPPALTIASTRLSTPPQLVSRSPGALCSLATPVGRTSETTTVTPLAASARAVELPMPIGLPQPVISATRDEWGMGFLPCVISLARIAGEGGRAAQRLVGEGLSAVPPSPVRGLRPRPPSPALRERGCRLNRPCALELCSVHQAATPWVEGVAPVHRAAIVPPYQIADPPFLAASEFFLDGVRPE